ncbi:MAG: PKD domain-containing protein [Solirubrobacteraceae bacterium]
MPTSSRSSCAAVGAIAVAAIVLALLAALAGPAAAQVPTTTRVSVGSNGAEANGESIRAAVSADGRYVAFVSSATNLVSGDTSIRNDVFVRDRVRGETTRVNLGPGGVEADFPTFSQRMSADGRLVTFSSSATNLVTPATSGVQVFLWDRATSAVRLVSRLPAPYVETTRASDISADGSRVTFTGVASAYTDVFVADTATGVTRRISEKGDGTRANGNVNRDSALSGDGRWVAWETNASDLVPGDTNGFVDIIAQDLLTGQRVRVSIAAGGTVEPDGDSENPALDGDGCRIAFSSQAKNLVAADDRSGAVKAFVRDRCEANTELLSRAGTGSTQGTGFLPDLSLNGCLAIFSSNGTGVLNPPPVGTSVGLALRDRCGGTTSRLDVSTSGEVPTEGTVSGFDLSPSGRYAVFASSAPTLVAGDTNARSDIFLRDRANNAKPAAKLVITDLGGGRFAADASGSSDPDGPTVTGQIAWNDGSPNDTGLQATHTYARAGTFTVIATITDDDGATSTASQNVTVASPAAPGTPGGPGTGAGTGGATTFGTGGGTGGGGGTTAPLPALVLDRVGLSSSAFGLVARGKRPSERRGAVLTLRLSDDATVTLAFRRARSGRKASGRCVVGRRRGTRCTSLRTVATTTRTLDAGTQTIAITGRIGSKILARGAHRLVVSARTADGRRSSTRTLSFTVTAGR